MKRKNLLLSSILIISYILSSCSSTKVEYTTFKDYVNIVKNATENQKDIFVFSSTSCAHCKAIRTALEEYKEKASDVHIYELSINTSNGKFSDATMGSFTGDASTDGLKQLDNRLTDFLNTINENILNNIEIDKYSTGKYSFVCTPLILFYDSGLEVKMINNTSYLELDKKGNATYESFASMMQYPSSYPEWTKPFDISSFE